MILISSIILGIFLLVIDTLLFKFSKKKFSIIQTVGKGVEKIGGENTWAKLLIVIGSPFLFVYFSTFFPEDTLGYWTFVILTVIAAAFLGAAIIGDWLEDKGFLGEEGLILPNKKAAKYFVIGLSTWMFGGIIAVNLGLDIEGPVGYVGGALGWIFIIAAFVVYWRARKTE